MDEYVKIIIKADEYMRKNLSEHRASHIRGVAIESRRLAVRYGYDPRKAFLAGYLHDCAKGFTKEENEFYVNKYNIDVPAEEWSIGNSLIHSKVGAFFAKEYFGVEDKEILDAIYYHTVGRPEMTLLDKIVFTADYIEPERDQNSFVPLSVLRPLSYEDLDKAVCEILRCCYEYITKKSSNYVSPDTKKTYDYYINK
ncbi:MAG: bis(5'-nucleosyl)-tetraphosphatase (symmetrical) YqeK [Lachnospiraceae bacterium]|nr:bis(5'-nucleosyl)-tetraphosphatase (symmetrical) YqeK [Lachnospiraceae bacterium]